MSILRGLEGVSCAAYFGWSLFASRKFIHPDHEEICHVHLSFHTTNRRLIYIDSSLSFWKESIKESYSQPCVSFSWNNHKRKSHNQTDRRLDIRNFQERKKTAPSDFRCHERYYTINNDGVVGSKDHRKEYNSSRRTAACGVISSYRDGKLITKVRNSIIRDLKGTRPGLHKYFVTSSYKTPELRSNKCVYPHCLPAPNHEPAGFFGVNKYVWISHTIAL